VDSETEQAASLQGEDDIRLADDLRARYGRAREELAKLIVGQQSVVEQVLITIFAGGNSLIVGVPGLAKTLLIHSIAQVLDLKFSRIQFTPDLMPSDITGTDLVQENPDSGRRELVFLPGPIFANIVLADEINRTPPKTQSALLEAMQEFTATVRGKQHEIERPFFVLATQNPIELEGTYPLPEAQLDRFLFNVILDYLSVDDELEVVNRYTTRMDIPTVEACTTREQILQFQQLVRDVPVAESVNRYAVNLIRSTRPKDPLAPEVVKRYIQYGASVRATMYVTLAAKARALMKGRYHVTQDDIAALALPVLRHRVLTNYFAESDGVDVDTVLSQVVAAAGGSALAAKAS